MFGADVQHFATGAEAADYLLANIRDANVGIGGSKTVDQLNVYDKLCENNNVIWHWKDGSDKSVFDRAMLADVYISSANAISETGEMVFIDGRGNRVGALGFGMDKSVYIVASTNKICPGVEDAIKRARSVAPQNLLRMPGKRPCAVAQKCVDCRAPDRMCRAMLILCGKEYGQKKLEVILVDEPLGL